MGKVFLTSDLHFGHDRLFVWGVRGYDSIEDMNETQVQKWNLIVSDEDDVYVLGDLMLGDPGNIEYIKRLKGKIHIVLGNHDTPNRIRMYHELPNVVEVEWAIMLIYRKYHFFLTHFPCMTGNLEKESLKQMTLNVFGHTHQKTMFYEDRPYMFHCGVDAHNGYPVEIETVIMKMKEKVKECEEFLDCEVIAAPGLEISSPEPEVAIGAQNGTETRCHKCVFDVNTCGSSDYFGECPIYKRDPPDGGYYG